MIGSSGGKQSSAFLWWLRTGKLPPALSPDGLEIKFNPWHDPEDGRFTFAGAGRRYAAGGTDAVGSEKRRAPSGSDRVPALGERSKSRPLTLPKRGTSRAETAARDSQRPVKRASPKVQPKHVEGSWPGSRPNPVAEFAGGVGEGLYDVGTRTVAGVRGALTTNPVTTVRNAGRGIAGMIDAAIAAEDTPARIQASRAASAVANASARDIGRVTGRVAGTVALAAAPGAAVTKAAALRRLRVARRRTTFAPPKIGWVKETTKSQKP